MRGGRMRGAAVGGPPQPRRCVCKASADCPSQAIFGLEWGRCGSSWLASCPLGWRVVELALFEGGACFGAGAVEEHALVLGCEAEQVADLGGGESADVAQRDHLSLLWGQGGDRGFEAADGVALFEALEACRRALPAAMKEALGIDGRLVGERAAADVAGGDAQQAGCVAVDQVGERRLVAGAECEDERAFAVVDGDAGHCAPFSTRSSSSPKSRRRSRMPYRCA